MITRAIKNWVLCILLAFATQASSTAFDNHASHQAGTEHVSFEHEHSAEQTGQSELNSTGFAGEAADFDCHHCCHCHGSHHVYLPVVVSHAGLTAFKGIQPDFYANLHKGFLRNLLRPPIV